MRPGRTFRCFGLVVSAVAGVVILCALIGPFGPTYSQVTAYQALDTDHVSGKQSQGAEGFQDHDSLKLQQPRTAEGIWSLRNIARSIKNLLKTKESSDLQGKQSQGAEGVQANDSVKLQQPRTAEGIGSVKKTTGVVDKKLKNKTKESSVLHATESHHGAPKAAPKKSKPNGAPSTKINGKATRIIEKNVTSKTKESSASQPFPKWWLEAWPRSAVHQTSVQYVGDQPFFPACTANLTVMKTTTFPLEPKNYLNNSKNPCWYEKSREKGLKCLPYVYLAGVAKCGTTDLARRLRMHPQVFEGTSKEYHWWERDRFEGESFEEYIKKIVGPEIEDLRADLKNKGSSVRIFGDFSPNYLWEPDNWQHLHGNQECTEPRVIHAQHIHHIKPDTKLILIFRHPTPRLYSRFVSRIPRNPELKGNTNVDFHRYVENGIKVYKDCFQQWSVRHCAYNESANKNALVRLVEGMYPVFMHDWLRVWPKEQMFIMRYEDYGGHERERLTELFDFLGLDRLNKTEMDKLMERHPINSGTEKYEAYGQLLPETRSLLDDFYQPFIQQFADMMKDKRFLWKDTSH